MISPQIDTYPMNDSLIIKKKKSIMIVDIQGRIQELFYTEISQSDTKEEDQM